MAFYKSIKIPKIEYKVGDVIMVHHDHLGKFMSGNWKDVPLIVHLNKDKGTYFAMCPENRVADITRLDSWYEEGYADFSKYYTRYMMPIKKVDVEISLP